MKYIVDNKKQVYLQFCPAILLFDEDVRELLDLFSLYKDGFLLKDGGIENQPYWYIQAMLELKSTLSYIESKEVERHNGTG